MADRPIHFSAPMVRALLDGRKTQTRRVLTPRPGAQARWLSAELLHSSPSCYLATVDGQLGAQMQHPLAGSMRNGIANDAMSPLTWIRLPYAPGDRLWVREAFNAFQFSQDGEEAWPVRIPTPAECNEADELGHRYGAPQIVFRESDRARKWFSDQKWRPSIHMPRWASRLTLTVTDVRVQRLQEISEEDAKAEGIVPASRRFPPFQGCPNQLRERTIYEWSGGWSVRAADAYAALWNSIHGPGAWDANPWVAAYTFTVHRCNIDQMEASAK